MTTDKKKKEQENHKTLNLSRSMQGSEISYHQIHAVLLLTACLGHAISRVGFTSTGLSVKSSSLMFVRRLDLASIARIGWIFLGDGNAHVDTIWIRVVSFHLVVSFDQIKFLRYTIATTRTIADEDCMAILGFLHVEVSGQFLEHVLDLELGFVLGNEVEGPFDNVGIFVRLVRYELDQQGLCGLLFWAMKWSKSTPISFSQHASCPRCQTAWVRSHR
mmetsp:Transcript_3924/g.11124  ORF Transcript_3924/g.11124 Transcript_3924/m.11124 type:complete len:218 (+) Transcript_3924:66-719(+)